MKMYELDLCCTIHCGQAQKIVGCVYEFLKKRELQVVGF